MKQHDHHTPEDLRGIELALDRLARAERAAAPAGLEMRLAAATAPDLTAEPLQIAVAQRSTSALPFRLAASLLVAGGLVAVMISRLNTSPVPVNESHVVTLIALEEDVELWLTLRTPDEFQHLSDDLDVLAVDTDAVGRSSVGDWTALEPGAL
jgi:hypothetical protein